ncbi:Cysteine-rich secretory protein family protein [Pseudoruegeria aquimaris]|uniref:Cysteine-rich secretory protein family protein n=1 Tax=Pseudoruegeria aquimaris TaxID=393663 RepID=A0A1Y5RV28_9RHOB|nr:CAP domain-containing protein [Pseudoruegeria aquimaris]SLN24861.1 Cysteine-rich secretory protein family protein [Pseudoruegeria aquimaris]
MSKLLATLFTGLLFLAACEPATPPVGPDGRPATTVYKISNRDAGQIQFRMLEGVNTLRAAAGVPQVQLNTALNNAAAAHSRDMSIQNRPWHFGSDGSSPLDRVARAGYPGPAVGEAISETFETELQTLAAWMEDPGSRGVILDPAARNMGFSWFQESNGKIWWTLVMGG